MVMDMAKRPTSSRKTSSTKSAQKTAKPAATATVTAPRPARRVAAPVPQPTAEQIAARAYEIFEARNGAPGNPSEDWLQAERELSAPPVRRPTRAKKP